MFDNFCQRGKASFVLGGQWGSEGKGAAAASIAIQLAKQGKHFDIVTTNAGAQAGHTSNHYGRTRVVFHLPTYSLIDTSLPTLTYLNAGSIIDPDVLERELLEQMPRRVRIHPNAAVITQECRDAENRADSAQTKIASTRKGVGEALSRKILRSGMLAKDHPFTKQFVDRIDLNYELRQGASVLVEVPQGHGLSIDGSFYPHCTSRNCTVMQGMSDAGIHPQFYGKSMLVLRTFPIRVGNIMDPDACKDGCQYGKDVGMPEHSCSDGCRYEQIGHSGDCHPDQQETSWEALGVKAEITTVTKRVRRVFTFSYQQAREALAATRPDIIYLTFCDYVRAGGDEYNYIIRSIGKAILELGLKPEIVFQNGPTTDDLYDHWPFIKGRDD